MFPIATTGVFYTSHKLFVFVGPDVVGQYVVIRKNIVFTGKEIYRDKNGLEIRIKFSRQISNILLVTYLPTILMNIINQATNYFIGEEFFGDVIAVNLTCMMVLSSIYIAVSGSLPVTSDIKYVEIWLLFSLIYPFFVVLINTFIHVERNKDRNNSTGQNKIAIMDKQQFKKINRKVQKITKLQMAELVANYFLPIIFCIFTISYFSVCSLTKEE